MNRSNVSQDPNFMKETFIITIIAYTSYIIYLAMHQV